MAEISSLSVLMSKIQAALGLVIAAYKKSNFCQKGQSIASKHFT